MSGVDAAFEASIDLEHDPFTSVVLRYRHALRFTESAAEDEQIRNALTQTSIREGLRIVPLLEYRGVAIDVLDETSGMHTHTLKSIDGAVSTACCQVEGAHHIVVESGGNTAAALAAYARGADIVVTCFVPEENLGLLDGDFFDHPNVHLVSVADPALVKPAAALYAERTGARRTPQMRGRLQASRLVGCFLRECLLAGVRYDWLAQTISAAFGPIGIYAALAGSMLESGFDDGAALERAEVPRFLGVQQAANCPLYRAWNGQSVGGSAPLHTTRGLLTPVMYDGAPGEYGTYPRLKTLLERSRGDLTTVDADEFRQALVTDDGCDVLATLRGRGIDISVVDGEVVEKTGLIAIAGVLKAIRSASIPRGNRVLVCLTSGARRSLKPAVPRARLADLDSLDVDTILGNDR